MDDHNISLQNALLVNTPPTQELVHVDRRDSDEHETDDFGIIYNRKTGAVVQDEHDYNVNGRTSNIEKYPNHKKDPIIEKFLDHVFARYYKLWFYLRGTPKIAFPMLITGCQKLLRNLNIKGCETLDGGSIDVADCLVCNNDSLVHTGNLHFRYFDYIMMFIGITVLTSILRRGIAEAHLSLRALSYHVFVRSSWYYFRRIVMIGVVGAICAGLSFVSSIFLAFKNAEEAQIVCAAGPHEGERIQLILSDYGDDLIFWIGLYVVSVVSYWPIIDLLIDLYDTPYKIFIEPDDMFVMHGELKEKFQLFERFSLIQHKVRMAHLLQEIKIQCQIHKVRPKFRIERTEDFILEAALGSLYKKGIVKKFKQKI